MNVLYAIPAESRVMMPYARQITSLVLENVLVQRPCLQVKSIGCHADSVRVCVCAAAAALNGPTCRDAQGQQVPCCVWQADPWVPFYASLNIVSTMWTVFLSVRPPTASALPFAACNLIAWDCKSKKSACRAAIMLASLHPAACLSIRA